MPIFPAVATRRVTQEEFRDIAHEVMRQVFAIHADFGRFFDESVYKQELAARMEGIALEVPVDVVHGGFVKRYFADVIVDGCGLFEFKAAEALHPSHRRQAIHYLFLFDLPHGKVVNVRAEKVGHEFINCHQRLEDLRNPLVDDRQWNPAVAGADCFRSVLMNLVTDLGTGLELSLFEEALVHLLAANCSDDSAIPVIGSKGMLTQQRMRLAAPGVAFKLTAFANPTGAFLAHARKFLNHTTLKAILWANITRSHITFTTIQR